MEPQLHRDTVRMDPPPAGTEPVRVVEQTAVPVGAAMAAAPVAVEERAVAGIAPVAPVEIERTESVRSVSPHAVAAGLLAVAMLVWGGVAMVRAGFEDDLREPVVEVFGLSGNAISGMVVAGIGLLLLIAAVSRDRGPTVFLTVVTGIAALIVAVEPDAGDSALGVDTMLPVLVAIGCGIVLLVALVAPTVSRRSRTVLAH